MDKGQELFESMFRLVDENDDIQTNNQSYYQNNEGYLTPEQEKFKEYIENYPGGFELIKY